jgi:hypothetical protein
MTVQAVDDVFRFGATWLAAVFAILAAFVAQKAFKWSQHAEPPDPAYHSNPFMPKDIRAEIEEAGDRESFGIKAAGAQSAATFLAAAAATEAATATPIPIAPVILGLVGIALALIQPTRAWRQSRLNARYARARGILSGFMVEHKLDFQGGREALGYTAFVEKHPEDAKLLRIKADPAAALEIHRYDMTPQQFLMAVGGEIAARPNVTVEGDLTNRVCRCGERTVEIYEHGGRVYMKPEAVDGFDPMPNTGYVQPNVPHFARLVLDRLTAP